MKVDAVDQKLQIPETMTKKLSAVNSPTKEDIDNKMKLVEQNRIKFLEQRVNTLKAHNESLSLAAERKQAFLENSEFPSTTSEVPLPEHLQERLKQFPMKSVAQIKANQKQAENNARETLELKVQKAKAHNESLSLAAERKQAFLENSEFPSTTSEVPLPEHLQERLKQFPMKSVAQIKANQKQAENNARETLELKVQKAKAHNESVEDVQGLKKSMLENISFTSNRKPVHIPTRLQKRLESLPKAKSGSDILESEQRVAQNREMILQKRVEKSRVMSLKAKQVSPTNSNPYNTVLSPLPTGR